MPSLAADWSNFFVAEVGAAAALSGLLFVAVSINLTRILAIEHLPDRAAETLYVLLGVLVVATFGLVPGQSLTALGFEVAGAGLAVWGICVRSQARAYRDAAARQWLLHRVVWTQLATVPFIVGGALLIGGHPSGLYWLCWRRSRPASRTPGCCSSKSSADGFAVERIRPAAPHLLRAVTRKAIGIADMA